MTEPNAIEQAITEHWGDRCPDVAEGCPCCEAWAQYDALTSKPESVTDADVERAVNAFVSAARHFKPVADGPTYQEHAMRAALEAALPSGVRVKPLEWEGDGHWSHGPDEGWMEEANTPFGWGYSIEFGREGNFKADSSFGWSQDGFDTPDEAKAAAQSDYERRILSALEPSQAPQPESVKDEPETARAIITPSLEDQLRAIDDTIRAGYEARNTLVGSTQAPQSAPAPAELEVVAWRRRDPDDTIPEEAAYQYSESKPSGFDDAGWLPLADHNDAQAHIAALTAKVESLTRELSDWKQGHEKSVKAHVEVLDRADTAEARLAQCMEALEFYAASENWRAGGPLDGNSGNYTGGPARTTLAALQQKGGQSDEA